MPIKFKERLATQPPGGWHFIEAGVTIRGETPQDVEDQILRYRIRNGITPGNPKQDLLNFCAVRWPNLISVTEEPQGMGAEHPIYRQAWEWLVSLSKITNPGDVPFEQAEEQKRICRECPLNLMYPAIPDEVKDDFERRSFLLRKGKECAGLGFCAHHRWDNRVSVYRNRNAINARENSPPCCWMNQNLEGLKLAGPELRIEKSSSED